MIINLGFVSISRKANCIICSQNFL